MLKSTLLNSNIHTVLSKFRHTDSIVIADAGLPIPDYIERIDLAIIQGLPSFLDVLKAVLAVSAIERIILAEEIKRHNAQIHQAILALFQEYNPSIEIEYVSHESFKSLTQEDACKAIIRTGECTPYANIILKSGVVF